MVVAEVVDDSLHPANEETSHSASKRINVVMEETYKCSQCMEIFPDRDTLFRHVRMEHQQHVQGRRAFRCDICQRSFRSMTGLRNHSRTHPVVLSATTSQLNDLTSAVEAAALAVSEVKDSEGAAEPTSANGPPAKMDVCDSETNHSSESSEADSYRNKTISDFITELTPTRLQRRRRSGIPVRRSAIFKDKRKSSSTHSSPESESLNIAKEMATPVKSLNSTTGRAEMTKRSGGTRSSRCSSIDTVNSERRKDTGKSLLPTERVKSRTPKQRNRSSRNTRKTSKEKESSATLRIASPFAKAMSTKLQSPVTDLKAQCSPVTRRRTPGSEKRKPRTPVARGTSHSSKTNTPSKLTESGKKGHQCSKCGKSFPDKAKLDVHFTVHARETPQKCGIPKDTLRRNLHQSQFSKDASPRPGNKEQPASYECSQCSRVFVRQKYLDAHSKVHDINTPYSCEFCDKKFRYLSSLRAHSYVHPRLKHNQDQQLEETCGRGTKNIGTNGRDIVANIFSLIFDTDSMVEMPFSCKMCTFKSPNPSELLVHMKSHSKRGPYTCKLCDKTYRLQSNLETHEKVHTINRLKDILVAKSVTRHQYE